VPLLAQSGHSLRQQNLSAFGPKQTKVDLHRCYFLDRCCLAQTHQFLAANDKTNLISRCFKQAYRNVLRNLDQERKDAEKDLALPQLVRAERDLAFAEKASAAAALNLQTTYNVPNYEAFISKRTATFCARERGPDLTDVFCFASSVSARGLNPCQSGALS
jgi:hypothetical protein